MLEKSCDNCSALPATQRADTQCDCCEDMDNWKPKRKRLAKHSKKDSKGLVWVACCECDRGGNGQSIDKCSCGWQCKRWNMQGCFMGTLIDGLEVKT